MNASKSRALLESLKKDILNGKYGSGQKFPSRRALAGRFGIAATTVQRALDELANQGLISRAKGSGSFVTKVGASRKIGLIVPGVAYSEFFSLVVGEISRCATRDGYVLLLGNMSSSRVSERIRRAKTFAKELVKEQVAGVIYQPFEFVENAEKQNKEIVSILDKAGIPVVLLSCDIELPPGRSKFDVVGINNMDAGYRLGNHLLSVGARKIDFLLRPNTAPSGRNRMRGIITAINAAAVCEDTGKGFRFRVLNCYGAKAMSRELEGHVIDILTTLIGWGTKPETVTTASPFIARTLKKVFPEIEVRASVNMRLTTLQAFKYLASLFDSYYLGRDVQRNLEMVKRFSDWCHSNGKKLCILANSGCLRNCPWQTYHDNLIAHSDEAMKVENVKGWNPHLCWTLYRDPKNFAEILKATWVRPEDLHRYDGLVDVVKLATRQHANPGMVMSAYERGRFEGNLLDLLEPGFSPAFRPHFIDNTAFPPDWPERTGSCARECTACGYCDSVFGKVSASLQERTT